ncbi:hypothetical protein BH09ACT1_BH09ACT1_21930 [soil metagenome]
MKSLSMSALAISVFVVSALTLSGCTTSGTTGTVKSPASSPSSASSTVSRIQINGDSLDVLDASGDSIKQIAYSADIAKTVSSLESLLGEKATHSTLPASSCNTDQDVYDWGDALNIRFPAGTDLDHPTIRATSNGQSIGDVTVGAPGDVGVGDLGSALLTAVPCSVVDDSIQPTTPPTQLWYDFDAKDDGAFVRADATTGKITTIMAPLAKVDYC